MFRKTILAIAALAAAVLAPAAADAATAARATGNVNLRAGPSTDYPRILVVENGARVTVFGCLSDRSWCDVEAYGARGWLSSRYISIFYRDRVYRPQPQVVVPGVTFSFGYWDRHYSDRPFIRDPRWRRDDGRDRRDDRWDRRDDRYDRRDERWDRRDDRWDRRDDRTERREEWRDDRREERVERREEWRDDRRPAFVENPMDSNATEERRSGAFTRSEGAVPPCIPGEPGCDLPFGAVPVR